MVKVINQVLKSARYQVLPHDGNPKNHAEPTTVGRNGIKANRLLKRRPSRGCFPVVTQELQRLTVKCKSVSKRRD